LPRGCAPRNDEIGSVWRRGQPEDHPRRR